MKPAGGIRTAKEAIQYLVVLYETLGPRWMTPDRFRFGASSPAQRRADADREGAHGRLPGPGPLHDRLGEGRQAAATPAAARCASRPSSRVTPGTVRARKSSTIAVWRTRSSTSNDAWPVAYV